MLCKLQLTAAVRRNSSGPHRAATSGAAAAPPRNRGSGERRPRDPCGLYRKRRHIIATCCNFMRLVAAVAACYSLLRLVAAVAAHHGRCCTVRPAAFATLSASCCILLHPRHLIASYSILLRPIAAYRPLLCRASVGTQPSPVIGDQVSKPQRAATNAINCNKLQ